MCMYIYYMYIYIHIYIYIFVALSCFICKRPFFALKKDFRESFANPTFIFRGVAAIHFCAVDTHSNSMQMVTA